MPKQGAGTAREALKLQPKAKNPCGKERRNALVLQLEAHKASLQQSLQQAVELQFQEHERQKVLVDLVCCQEEIQRILNYHEGLLQKAPAHAAAGKTASPPAGLVSGTNRLNRLLATATAEQIQQVMLLQPEDWIRIDTENFQKLVVLLELADRELIAECTASANEPNTDTSSSIASIRHLLHSAAQTAAVVDGDKGSAATGAADTAIHQDGSVHAPSVLQQLQSTVEYAMYRAGLALLHNHAPYYIAASCHHLTGQMQTPPAELVKTILARLRLTDLQLLHLRIVIEEFERLSRDTQQQGSQLAEQIAKLSLQQLVDGIRQQGREVSFHDNLNSGIVAATNSKNNDSDTQQNGQSSEPTATALSAAAAAEVAADSIAADDSMRQRLVAHMDRYVGQRNVQICVTAWFISNTLSPRQVAIIIVASFPYSPNLHAVAEAAKQLHKQKQDERLARVVSVDDGDLPSESVGASKSAASGHKQQQQQLQQPGDAEPGVCAWGKEVVEHMERRCAMLQQQLQQWWEDIGASV